MHIFKSDLWTCQTTHFGCTCLHITLICICPFKVGSIATAKPETPYRYCIISCVTNNETLNVISGKMLNPVLHMVPHQCACMWVFKDENTKLQILMVLLQYVFFAHNCVNLICMNLLNHIEVYEFSTLYACMCNFKSEFFLNVELQFIWIWHHGTVVVCNDLNVIPVKILKTFHSKMI